MPDKFVIESADEVAKSEALALEALVYSEDYGFIPDPEPYARYFVARSIDSSVIASFRILGPENRPFEFEPFVPLNFLGPERVPALIGRLCVRKDRRSVRSQSSLHVQLLRTAFTYARQQGFTDFVQFTFPVLRVFYERALFNRTDLRFFHSGYRQEMELFHLDLDMVEQGIRTGDRRVTMLYGAGFD